MLRKIRIIIAAVFFIGLTLLFLDFTGALHAWLGWMAKIQFLPAVLALNFVVVLLLVALTLLFGRVYCSVICPMGIFQDIISWAHGRSSKKAKFRFTYKPERKALRYGVLAVFVVLVAAGLMSVAALIAPYSAYGRIVQNIFSPLYIWGNNLLAYIAERMGSYAFYTKEVWMGSLPVFIVAVVTLVVIFILAWKGGRTYCNSICPVGTVLGFLSKYSLFGINIDESKCVSCGLCGRRCKGSCLSTKEHSVDYSRCVACMDCIDACKEGAVSYGLRKRKASVKPSEPAQRLENQKDSQDSRRAFIAVGAMALGSATLKAQEQKLDGGLAVILDKKAPKRETPIVPPGAQGHWHIARHCIGCQLCVAACPNGVLRPSTSLAHFMQIESSYEKGFCRPECTECSKVCPAGAIHRITKEEKTAISIGHAVWIEENCLAAKEENNCGLCARRCPSGAITMVHKVPGDKKSPLIPAVNTGKCIGCGACENLCPVRPFSAIYVEGNARHIEI